MLRHAAASLAFIVVTPALTACPTPVPNGPTSPHVGANDDDAGNDDDDDDGTDDGDANVDSDGDGTRNEADDDIDGDGVPNTEDDDMDGDGVANVADDDVDGDGTPNAEDATAAGTATGATGPQGDIDGDGVPNAYDQDNDGDGVPDFVAGVGSCDGSTPASDEGHDCDGYCIGVEGAFRACDDGAPAGTGLPDVDGDGIPDRDDDDDDVPPTDDVPMCTVTSFDVSAVTTIPPRILLVVDKSGSMNDQATGFGGSKWNAARTALQEVVTGSDAQFGLMLYPNGDADNDACEVGSLRVPVSTDTSNIVNTLAATSPSGGTPTATTLVEARSIMDGLSADGGTRAVVLATDGGPNCNASLDPDTCTCVTLHQEDCQQLVENCLDDANAVAAASQVAAAGYPLFVIGIPGSENFANVLDSMANAGGTGQVFNATSGDALAQRIDDITQVLASCSFTLTDPVPAGATVTVSVDGVDVSADAQNGFTLAADALELHGAACDQVQNGLQAGATVAMQVCE